MAGGGYASKARIDGHVSSAVQIGVVVGCKVFRRVLVAAECRGIVKDVLVVDIGDVIDVGHFVDGDVVVGVTHKVVARSWIVDSALPDGEVERPVATAVTDSQCGRISHFGRR